MSQPFHRMAPALPGLIACLAWSVLVPGVNGVDAQDAGGLEDVAVKDVTSKQVSLEEARRSLHRAVKFFREEASSQGGYVFRWSEDLSEREGEQKADEMMAWIEPPATPAVGNAYLNAYRLTNDSVLLDAAHDTARALLRGQLISGGWTENIVFDAERRSQYAYRVDAGEVGKRRNRTTFDDNKTQSVIGFLMRLDTAAPGRDRSIHEAVEYALQGVLDAQYPNGAWPQQYTEPADPASYPVLAASYPKEWSRTFPNEKYTGFYTLNDETMSDLIDVMLEAYDKYGDARYFDAATRGGEFFLLAQMPDPQPGWAQQYDAAMHPTWARKFEPPAISGNESQKVMRSLLMLYRRTQDARFLEAVERALAYYQKSLLPDGQLARFYELQTNRPLYFTRDYQLTYSSDDLPTHYGFIVDSSLPRIVAELEKIRATAPKDLWRLKQPSRPKRSSELDREAKRVIESMDARGAWTEKGKLEHGKSSTNRIINARTFIKNLTTLAEWIAANE